MHESLIGCLQRRFVCTHYNAFSGPGSDPAAAAWLKGLDGLDAIGGARYGVIVTPSGKPIVSFGFKRAEFTAALRKALAAEPHLARMTAEEQAALDAAEETPFRADAQLAATQIKADLLDAQGARVLLDRVIAMEAADDMTVVLRTMALYLLGHLAAIDIDKPDRHASQASFEAMGAVPRSLRDDVALDEISLDVRLKPGRGFYTGWEFKPGTPTQEHVTTLERLIRAHPESNRIGQMHFYLGLARFKEGDTEGANHAWAAHVGNYPEDRWAMLSHIHHTDYQFSPSKKSGPGSSSGGVLSMGDLENNPAMLRSLIKSLENGQGTVQGGNKQAMLERFRAMLKVAEARQAEQDEDK